MFLISTAEAAEAAEAAEPAAIVDADDAHYFEESGRVEEAAAWYLAHFEDDGTARSVIAYVNAVGQLPTWRTPALAQQVRDWGAIHPDASDVGVAVAASLSLDALGARGWGAPFQVGGEWCDEALRALEPLPAEEGRLRYRVLRARVAAQKACGLSREADEQALRTLAASGKAGPFAQAFYGRDDGVDESDLAALEAAYDETPANLRWLSAYARADTTGPSANEARAWMLEHAKGLAASDRPVFVSAAIAVLSSAEADVTQARNHLREIDPGNRFNAWASEHPSKPPPPDATVDPTTLLDPAARLAALRDEPVPKDNWGAVAHWSALADSAGAAGDPSLELEALDRLWRVSPSSEPNVRFAEAAADRGERLHAASRAIKIAVRRYDRSYSTERDALDEQRQRFAHALVVQGRVDVARGRTDRGAKELSRALVVGGPNADSFLGLGMMESTHDSAAAPLLASALAALPEDDPRRDGALRALNERLANGKGWVPDADTYVRASRQSPVGSDPPLDARPFTDLPIHIDGQERMLLDVPGPLVVDVWATWCGPCKEALPHLETLARTYEGRVTVIAASVDEEAATAEAYLDARGDPSFVPGWLDPTSVKKLGVSGIPVVYVFDAEHRLVARLPGYSPGSRAIESTIEKILRE